MKPIKTKSRVDRRRAFSLLELLIAFSVIAVVSGMCLFNIWGARNAHAQKEVVAGIEKNIKLAKTMAMLSYDEVRVLFSEKEQGWQMQLEGILTASAPLAIQISSPRLLEGVRKVSVEPPGNALSHDLFISFLPFASDRAGKTIELLFSDDTRYVITCEQTKEPQHEYPPQVLKKEKELVYTA